MKIRMLVAGAAALLASGVAVGAAAPAHAQPGDADVAINLVGTTVADGVSGKFATLTLSNNGPADAEGIEFTYDVSGLDTSKVDILLEDCSPDSGGIAVCIIDPDGLANGEHVNFVDFLEVVPGASGDAGSITMSITHAGSDPEPGNNTVTAPVTISGSGPDLLVIAPDVTNEADVDLTGGTPWQVIDSPLLPGSDALVGVFVANQGSAATSGVEMSIELPDHVSFTLPEPDCTHAAGDSSTTCEYASVALAPGYDPGGVDYCAESGTCGWFLFPVKVADTAPSPASLTGGLAEAWDLQALQLRSAAPASLPANFTTEKPVVDVDPSDNKSEFTVFVSEPADDGGSGGELPVTGTSAALIGGAGVAVLVAGGALFFLARRRRLVLAAPDSDG